MTSGTACADSDEVVVLVVTASVGLSGVDVAREGTVAVAVASDSGDSAWSTLGPADGDRVALAPDDRRRAAAAAAEEAEDAEAPAALPPRFVLAKNDMTAC